MLPAAIIVPFREHLAKLFDRFEHERKLREPGVSLPCALVRKYPNAATQWGWQSQPASCHTLRHCFATHLLEAGHDITSAQFEMPYSHLYVDGNYVTPAEMRDMAAAIRQR